MGGRGIVNKSDKRPMSQKRVLVTIERSDDHEDHLQEAIDRKAALDAGSTGIVTTAYGTKIGNAQIAQTAVSTRAPGAVENRNSVFGILFLEEDDLKRQMQALVDNLAGSIDAKIALALSNGFQVVDFGTINKQDFVVVDGPTSGSARLVAKGLQVRSFHEWGFQNDKELDWQYVEPSLQATKVVSGLTPGNKIKFRHRMFTKDGPGEWHYDELIIR
jgi:hypothetical protein